MIADITLDFKAQLLVGKACMPFVNETVSFSLEACCIVEIHVESVVLLLYLCHFLG